MVQHEADKTLEELLELDLEYRLTVAIRINPHDPCPCAQYLINRREVLLPEIMKKSEETGENPAEIFHRFAQRLHARHEEN